MLDRLYDLSDISITVIFAGVSGACFIAAPLIGGRLGWTVADRELDYLGRAQMTISALMAVLLSFSLIQVNGNFRRTQEAIDREAGQIELIDWLLRNYGAAPATALRTPLLAYAQSILKDEWPELENGRESAQTGALLQRFSAAAFALDPQPGRQLTIYADLLRALDNLADLRSQRLAAAQQHLTGTFWLLIFALMLLIAGLSLAVPPMPGQSLPIAARGIALALLAALVFTMDTPLKGESSVAPTPFEHALAVLQNGQ